MASIQNNRWLITSEGELEASIQHLRSGIRILVFRPEAWDLKDLLERFLTIPERELIDYSQPGPCLGPGCTHASHR
jgi:hypothetical protein